MTVDTHAGMWTFHIIGQPPRRRDRSARPQPRLHPRMPAGHGDEDLGVRLHTGEDVVVQRRPDGLALQIGIGALAAFDRVVVDQDPVGSNRCNAGVGTGRPLV